MAKKNGDVGLKWTTECLACVATYKILEAEEFMDEFEDADYPFPEGKKLKMKQLWFYPQTTTSDAILTLLASQRARDFLGYLVDVYGVKKKNKEEESSAIVKRLAAIFKDADKTLLDLAQEVEASVRFPGN